MMESEEKYESIYKELRMKSFSFSTIAEALDWISLRYKDYISKSYPPSFVLSPYKKNYQVMYIGLSTEKVKNIADIKEEILKEINPDLDKSRVNKLDPEFQMEVFKFISEHKFSDELFTVGVVKKVFENQRYLCLDLIKKDGGLPEIEIKEKRYIQKEPGNKKDKKVTELIAGIIGVKGIPEYVIVVPVYDSPGGYLLGFVHLYFDKKEKRKKFIEEEINHATSYIDEIIRGAYFKGKIEEKIYSFEDRFDVIDQWKEFISEVFYWDKVEWEVGSDGVELYDYNGGVLKLNVGRLVEVSGFRKPFMVSGGGSEILCGEIKDKKGKEFFEFRLGIMRESLVKFLQKWEWLQMHKMRVYHSIMANNRRHNITGHVILRDNFYKEGEIKKEIREHRKLDVYLAERESFITLATSTLTLSDEPFLLRELIAPFEEGEQRQNKLIDGILSFFGREGLTINNCINKDFLISVPGGQVGAHGFYIILENIISNSAKYGDDSKKAMELNIKICDGNDNETIMLKIYSNLDIDESGEKIEKIKNVMNEPIIDPRTGAPIYRRRGLNEMRFCAGFLLGFNSKYYFNNGKDPLNVEREGNEIVYYLKLRKFTLVEKNNLKSDPFIFVVTETEIMEDVIKNRERYPNRVIFVSNSKEDRRDMGIVTVPKDTNTDDFIDLYRMWIEKFFGLNEKIKLLICFENDARETWDKELIESFNNNSENKIELVELVKLKGDREIKSWLEEVKNKKFRYISYEGHNILTKVIKKGNMRIPGERIARVTFGSEHTFIYHPPKKDEFLFNFFILSLVESALMRIYINDERIEGKLKPKEDEPNKALIYTGKDEVKKGEKFHIAVYHRGLEERGKSKKVKAVYDMITSLRVIDDIKDERYVDFSAIYGYFMEGYKIDKYHLAQLLLSTYSKQKSQIALP